MLRHLFRHALYPTHATLKCSLIRITTTTLLPPPTIHFIKKNNLTTKNSNHRQQSPWEPWEDALIRDFITQNGRKYTELVEHCLPHRTVSIVEQRWTEVLKPNMRRGGFSKQELDIVRQAVTELGESHWSQIAKDYLPQRSPRSIRYAYYYHCTPERYEQALDLDNKQTHRKKRLPWTPEEDQLLLQGYNELGRQWAKISRQYLPHRFRVNIRDRYDEALDPTIKKEAWTESELDLLLRRHIMYGEDWNKIAEGLDGRTPRACQRKWIQKIGPSLNSNNILHPNNDNKRMDVKHDHTSNKRQWSRKETKLFWHLACAHDCHWAQVAKIIGHDRMACSYKFYDDIKQMQPLLDMQYNDANNNNSIESSLKQRSDETKLEWKRRVAVQMRDWIDNQYTLNTDPSTGALIVTDRSHWTDADIEMLKSTTENKQRIHWRKVAVKVGKSATRCRNKYLELQGPKIRRGPWTPEEDEQLLDFINTYGTRWGKISEEMHKKNVSDDGVRSAVQCRYRWNHKLKYNDQFMTEGNFNEQEKELVREGVHMFGNNWAAISETYLPNRTPGQCMRWWHQYGQNTGRWTPEEDEKLRFAVKEYGESLWQDVGSLVLTRTPAQCRTRWFQKLKPGIKQGPWSQEEQMQLAELVQNTRDTSNHVNWDQIAEELGTGRSSWACRYKYDYMVQTGNKFGLRGRSNKMKM
ncbi:Homeodomain-like protein [Circinella umbellata]|nr:Homeodomain-like protein [Circinella umbellata]